MFDYSRLVGRIVEKFGTRQAFAKAIGITQQTISNKINAKSDLSSAEIVKWADALDINHDEIADYFFAQKV